MSSLSEAKPAKQPLSICKVHNEPVSKFDKLSFTFTCSQCEQGEAIVSSNLKTYFLEYIDKNYETIKKIICPERRKWVYSARKLIQLASVCKFIDSISKNIVYCDKHNYKQAIHINLSDFSVFCEECDVSLLETISIDPKNIEEIIEKGLEKIKNSESLKLNKFHLKLKNQHSKALSLIIFEIKRLNLSSTSLIPRCSLCNKTLSYGSLTPILLNCKHTICFCCYMIENNDVCGIDKLPIEVDENFDEKAFDKHDLRCHNNHSLFNCLGKIYKLPCFHNCCEKCKNFDVCQRCELGFDNKNLKENNKIMNIVDLFKLFCNQHNLYCQSVDVIDLRGICTNCTTNNPCINDIITIRNLAKNTLLDLLENKGYKNRRCKIEVLKNIAYNRVLTLTQYFNTLQYFLMRKNPELNLSQVYEIKRFTKLLPNDSVTKIWKNEKEDACGFKIMFKKPVLLHGIIFGGSIRKGIFYKPSANEKIKIRLVTQNNEVKYENDFYNNLNMEENTIKFDHILKIKENSEYSIVVNVIGSFRHGLCFSQISTEGLSLQRLDASFKEIGNNVVGGPLLGFIVSEFCPYPIN